MASDSRKIGEVEGVTLFGCFWDSFVAKAIPPVGNPGSAGSVRIPPSSSLVHLPDLVLAVMGRER